MCCVGQDFFRVNPLGYGATYQAHPVALACGYEVVKYTIAEDIVGKAYALEPVLKELPKDWQPKVLQS